MKLKLQKIIYILAFTHLFNIKDEIKTSKINIYERSHSYLI